MATFGQRLRKIRIENNLTQKDLAKIFKVSESAIGMYERDEREPSFKLTNEIADYFDVSADYLLGRSVSKAPSEGSAYMGGGRDWTDEERRVAEAAIESWRRMKREQLKQDEK